MNKFIHWTPRILSIIFIGFLTLLSLDVFGTGLNFWETAMAFFMHNLPVLFLIITLIISWKYEIVGGIIFILAGLFYVTLIMKNPFEWYAIIWIIQISGVAFLIGTLFLIGWFKKQKNKF